MSHSATKLRTAALLLFLTWLNVLNFVDRTLIGNLAKQIAEDPELNIKYETIGFLTGYGFILFYSLVGVGMGTLADRCHRPRLMAMGLALWSTLTAATGVARNFAQIAACRAFVGIGEATLTPSALSMLGDRFPARLRAFASGTYYAGIPLGAGLGMIVSAWLLPSYGWRGCFLILGLLGIVFVVPVLLLRDDARRRPSAADPTSPAAVSPPAPAGGVLWPLLKLLCVSPALICTLAAAVLAVYAQSSSIFVLTWMQTERGMDYTTAATVGGWLYLIGGTLGSVCGGLVGDWFNRLFPSGGRQWFLALGHLVFAPLSVLFFLGDVNAWYFRPLWLTTSFGSMVWYGALFSTITELAPPRCRATAIALLLFCMNFLGSGPGPWVTGWIGGNLPALVSESGTARDVLVPLLDFLGLEATQSFTFALLTSVAVGFLGLPFNIIAALRYRRDVAKAQEPGVVG